MYKRKSSLSKGALVNIPAVSGFFFKNHSGMEISLGNSCCSSLIFGLGGEKNVHFMIICGDTDEVGSA